MRNRAGEGAWAWDAALIQTAINEAPLHYQGQSLRIDRLVQRRAVQADDALAGWWVLDYKLGATPEQEPAYVAQMRGYVADACDDGPRLRVADVRGIRFIPGVPPFLPDRVDLTDDTPVNYIVHAIRDAADDDSEP